MYAGSSQLQLLKWTQMTQQMSWENSKWHWWCLCFGCSDVLNALKAQRLRPRERVQLMEMPMAVLVGILIMRWLEHVGTNAHCFNRLGMGPLSFAFLDFGWKLMPRKTSLANSIAGRFSKFRPAALWHTATLWHARFCWRSSEDSATSQGCHSSSNGGCLSCGVASPSHSCHFQNLQHLTTK